MIPWYWQYDDMQAYTPCNHTSQRARTASAQGLETVTLFAGTDREQVYYMCPGNGCDVGFLSPQDARAHCKPYRRSDTGKPIY